MSKHIELVKKWLEDPSSVTAEELKANANAASAVDRAADAAAYYAAADDYYAATDAYYTSDAYYASASANAAAIGVAHYVRKYERLTGEKGNE